MAGWLGDRPALLRWYRWFFAALAAIAITVQFVDRLRTATDFSIVNFFSFFTILSNVVAIVVFGWGAAARALPAWFDEVRGASTLYLTITGIVFAALLADLPEELQVTIPWVDTVVHRIMPVAVLLDWLLAPPRRRIPMMSALRWLSFPIAYAAYTIIRGPFADWYPYPFLDPRDDGYLSVATTAAVLAVGMVALALGVAWLGNWLSARPKTE